MTDDISLTIPPTFISVNEEILRLAIEVAETAIDNAKLLLNQHKALVRESGGRRDNAVSRLYSEEIRQAAKLRDDIRKEFGWPPVEAEQD